MLKIKFHAAWTLVIVDMTTHAHPPILSLEHVQPKTIPGRLPRWCSLPMPGISLVVSDLNSLRKSVIPIDVKRAYSIGSAPCDDVNLMELRDLRLQIMHHRNGNVYISTSGPPHPKVTATLGGEILNLSTNPIPWNWDSPIDICGIQLSVTKHVGSRVLRDCLRNFCTDDYQTHDNTIKNMSRKAPLPSREPGLCNSNTPASLKRRTKRRKPDDLADVVRSVKFVDT